MRYHYSIVRFVPDPVRGEFVNVGAIVGCEETQDWDWRMVSNQRRIRQLDNSEATGAVWQFFESISRVIVASDEGGLPQFSREPEPSEEWLNGLWRTYRNTVQLTQPSPMIAETADQALELLFDRIVLDPARRRFEFLKKTVATVALRRAYGMVTLPPGYRVLEKVELFSGHHREAIDFAVVGDEVRQLVQAWSFEIPDQDRLAEDVKAWGWTIEDLRERGGILGGRYATEARVPRDVDVRVVYVPPQNLDRGAWIDAQNVFTKLGLTAVPAQGANTIAEAVMAR